MEPITTIAVTALVSSLVGAVVSTMLTLLKAGGKKAIERTEAERKADEAMRAGMRALLWRELQVIHVKAAEDGGMTVADRRHLESVYSAYHGNGGNGTGTRLYEDAMSRPVLD